MTPEDEAAERAQVIAEAWSWVGTPYRDNAKIKGPVGCVDCAGLMIACYCDQGIVDPVGDIRYHPHWHLHRERELYLEWIEGRAVQVAAPTPGDLVIYRFGRTFSHTGVVVSATHLIHANTKDRMVAESELNQVELCWEANPGQPTRRRPMRYYDPWAQRRMVA